MGNTKYSIGFCLKGPLAENEIDSAFGEVKVAEINESDADFEVRNSVFSQN